MGKLGAAVVLIAALGCPHPRPPPPGSGWTVVLNDLPAPLKAAWQAPDGVLYAVGGNANGPLVLRHDAQGWWTMDPGTREALWWVHGFSSSQVYAVGEHGTITVFDGHSWQVQRSGDPFILYGVWGSSPQDLWAVGGAPDFTHAGPVALHFTGEWTTFDTGLPAQADLFKVWGSASHDVYVVGDNGVIGHFDGTSFQAEPNPATDRLVTVFGTSAQDVYAVGGLQGAVAIHSDGSRWSVRAPPGTLPQNLFGVAAVPGHALYVGPLGLMAEDDGGSVNVLPAVTPYDLHGALAVQDGWVAVGGDLESATGLGVLVTSGGLRGGTLQPWPYPGQPLPDAGPGFDAGPSSDAGAVDGGGADAGTADAGSDAGVDGGSDGGAPCVLDAGLAPGAYCKDNFNCCQAPASCWFFLYGPSPTYLCAQLCNTASDCAAYGPGACCALPGPQVMTPVCTPLGSGQCDAG